MKDWENINNEEVVCYCKGINKGVIVSAIKDGKNTLIEIQLSTNACTGSECKTKNPSGKCCSKDIIELIIIYGNGSEGRSNCTGNCCCS